MELLVYKDDILEEQRFTMLESNYSKEVTLYITYSAGSTIMIDNCTVYYQINFVGKEYIVDIYNLSLQNDTLNDTINFYYPYSEVRWPMILAKSIHSSILINVVTLTVLSKGIIIACTILLFLQLCNVMPLMGFNLSEELRVFLKSLYFSNLDFNCFFKMY